ncbi:MAG: TetR/AcrR family transcriptional regulator [Oligoflexia bacterium]|nr:TetR/AcrR family transcriptional regulator [Oligoflexia bacterium]
MQEPTSRTTNGTEDKILENALKHFCEFGYNGTSVREITAASDVTKPTLYYYFKNKEELFTKLATTCFNYLLSTYQAYDSKAKNFEEAIHALFDSAESVIRNNPYALRFVYGLAVAPQRGTPEVGFIEFLHKNEERIEVLVRNAVNSGECHESNAKTAATLLSGLNALFYRDLLANQLTDERKVVFKNAVHGILHCSAHRP